MIPEYYESPEEWQKIVFKGIDDIIPEFTSHRMAKQYYKDLFELFNLKPEFKLRFEVSFVSLHLK